MYLIINALRNLKRNKGRNILISLITLAIILTVSVSIVINTTVNSITKDYKERFGAEVTLFLDTNIAKEYTEVQYPTAQQQMEFAKSDFLQKTDYQSSLSVALQDLKALGSDVINGNASLQGADSLSPVAKILASSDLNINEDFAKGRRSILTGKIFEKTNECIISEDFAQLNNLNIGDSITITNTDKNKLMPHILTISGIYQDSLYTNNDKLQYPLLNRGNEIFTNLKTALEIEMYESRGSLNSTYYLKDPSMLEAFQKEVANKGLAPYYRVTIDEEGYNNIVGPVEGITKIVTTFLIVVLIFGGLILLFISVMSIRERKYEIGVLRAMGMKRKKAIIGIVSESLIITLICLSIGMTFSSTLSQPIADSLLEEQIRNTEEIKQNSGTIELTPGTEKETAISKITVQLTPEAIGQISALSLLLVMISSIAGILYITRLEPMKILFERN